ncbi:hypothetical protein CQA62_02750 [Helicobacter cholecystus]|uniref:Uncharacterized protein n=1 Tax=Helicobacter cholecystus TaxID=45498 RepID=A0A3D8IY92_9HELI|nr:hypothetical protein [Helicobacter cholecystus]RDU69584.1 hypothetical protein CQA62_02750 [Helicobacter cholecystus]VEJ24141.1 Uncharacterised protein [Helicobacter cholecystus]
MIGIEFIASDHFHADIYILREFRNYVAYDFIILPDNPLGCASPSSLLCAKMLQDILQIPCYPCISGRGKSRENILSWLKGAKYAGIEGIACVSGDGEGWGCSIEEILSEARGFKEVITTSKSWRHKRSLGATKAIHQPFFLHPFPPLQEGVIPSFMPIFSHATFNSLQEKKLDFFIPSAYKNSNNLIKSNQELWQEFIQRDFYLIVLNLRKQLHFFKELMH